MQIGTLVQMSEGVISNPDTKDYFKYIIARLYMNKEIIRGDLFYYNFGKCEGSIQNGVRPVLVVQANNFNKNAPTVIIASLTSVIKKRYLPSHIVIGDKFGLKKPSMVLLEQLKTVNKSELIEYIGTITDEKLLKIINSSLKKTMGLWVEHRNEKDIYCLCPKCLHGYLSQPNFFVRRVDPFAKTRDKCFKCENLGWKYHISQRKSKV